MQAGTHQWQDDAHVKLGSVLNNYANIFDLLMKMRQSANHPDLVTKKEKISDNKQLVCMLCNEPPEVRDIYLHTILYSFMLTAR